MLEGDTYVRTHARTRAHTHMNTLARVLTHIHTHTYTSAGLGVKGDTHTHTQVLVSRIIDRTLRPMFPPGFCREVQILSWVLAYDKAIVWV